MTEQEIIKYINELGYSTKYISKEQIKDETPYFIQQGYIDAWKHLSPKRRLEIIEALNPEAIKALIDNIHFGAGFIAELPELLRQETLDLMKKLVHRDDNKHYDYNLKFNNKLKIGNNIKLDLPQRRPVVTINKPNYQYTNIKALLEFLWDKGFFKGLKTKRGYAVSHKYATDGIMGPVTLKAMQKALKAGVDLSKFTSSNGMPTVTINNTEPIDEEAIHTWKIENNVERPYGIVTKGDFPMFTVYKKGVPTYSVPVLIGKSRLDVGDIFSTKGDGDKGIYGFMRRHQSTNTAAGVYTIYDPGVVPPFYIFSEPLLPLIDSAHPIGDTSYSRMSLHSISSPKRWALHVPLTIRRSTSGCTEFGCGEISSIINNHILESGDSVYIMPEVEGNHFVRFNGGKPRMEWGPNNPSQKVVYYKGTPVTLNYKNEDY